jgi:hypothetical protein
VALPVAAQVNDTYVIPAVANVPGDFGTRWATQISIFNPQLDYPLAVTIVYVPSGGAEGVEATIEIGENSTASSPNILDDLFGISGTGALLLAAFPEENPGVPDDVLSRAFLVTSNTYNNARTGTFGQTIPGVWAGLQDFDTDGISAIAHGIINSSSQGFRTNVGAVNLGRFSVTMRVSVYDEDGRTILNRAPFNIPPLAHFQDRLPIQVENGSIEFFVDDPNLDAVVFPYTSTIDQLSGDPTYQSPTLLASPSVLFGKGKVKAVQAAVNPGKKIELAFARQVREAAASVGRVDLKLKRNVSPSS